MLVQRRGTIHPATFLGKGKVEELKELVERRDAELVIFDDDLSPFRTLNEVRDVVGLVSALG